MQEYPIRKKSTLRFLYRIARQLDMSITAVSCPVKRREAIDSNFKEKALQLIHN
jgi:hypothetical protein